MEDCTLCLVVNQGRKSYMGGGGWGGGGGGGGEVD